MRGHLSRLLAGPVLLTGLALATIPAQAQITVTLLNPIVNIGRPNLNTTGSGQLFGTVIVQSGFDLIGLTEIESPSNGAFVIPQGELNITPQFSSAADPLTNGANFFGPILTIIVDGSPSRPDGLYSQDVNPNDSNAFSEITFAVRNLDTNEITTVTQQFGVNLFDAPEPGTVALVSMGFLPLLGIVRRRK